MHPQHSVHLMKPHVVHQGADKTTQDADNHPPGGHLQIGNPGKQTNRVRALPFSCCGKQKIACHIQKASDDSNDHPAPGRLIFQINLHFSPPLRVLVLLRNIRPSAWKFSLLTIC